MSSAFQFVNVPTGVWIDEHGRIVRPAEPAWTSTRIDTYGGKPLAIEGDAERAQEYFERAQQLNPDDWNYYRLAWSFTGDAGKKWLEKIQKQEQPYYPKLALKKQG